MKLRGGGRLWTTRFLSVIEIEKQGKFLTGPKVTTFMSNCYKPSYPSKHASPVY
jgi:hypothetical protein